MDNYSDDVDDYAYTEVAIDYNAGFVGAMAGIVEHSVSVKLRADPGIEPDQEFFVEARVMEETGQHSTIDTYIHCDTLLPPRYVTGLTFRYFVDLVSITQGLTVPMSRLPLTTLRTRRNLSLTPMGRGGHLITWKAVGRRP